MMNTKIKDLSLLPDKTKLANAISDYLNSNEAKQHKITGVCATTLNGVVTITWEIDGKIGV